MCPIIQYNIVVYVYFDTDLSTKKFFFEFLTIIWSHPNQSFISIIGRLGATLVTVLLSVGYCTVSSVAAPPRHPVPSISNTSVTVPRWCARDAVQYLTSSS